MQQQRAKARTSDLTLEASKEKKVTRTLEGDGGQSETPLPLLLLTQFIRLK